jgi:hypothetical protein
MAKLNMVERMLNRKSQMRHGVRLEALDEVCHL